MKIFEIFDKIEDFLDFDQTCIFISPLKFCKLLKMTKIHNWNDQNTQVGEEEEEEEEEYKEHKVASMSGDLKIFQRNFTNVIS